MPAKQDRQVRHIKKQYIGDGMSPERAERLAWATVRKQEREKRREGRRHKK